MEIEKHFELLLNKYDLGYLYNKFICLSVLTTTIKEGFYWALIYLSEIVKTNPEQITKCSTMLIGLIGINIPLERYFSYTKALLLKNLKLSNTKHFNERIINMSKKELLSFDLVEYFNILEHFNENTDEYILNIKNKYDIPVRCISLIVIALNKKYGLLVGLFAIFYAIVRSLNEHKIIKENKLTKQYFYYDAIIRNYIINGKNFLINDEFNKEYLTNNFNNFENINKQISELNNDLDMKVNIFMFAFIIIIIWARIKELNQYDFFYYFLIIYDVEFIADKLNEYYKSKVNHNKMVERLNYLNSFVPVNFKSLDKIKVDSITINKIKNTKPKLENINPIIIKPNEHILVNGESGSGKTTLFYVLKGIVKPEQLDITPSIELINSQTYLTLPNHKSLFSGNLYDIISNYENNPDKNLIKYALISSKINHKLDKNEFVNIDKLSGGERIRLLIARIIYAVKTKHYNILLFDEIDENLNDELAEEICLNLRTIFKDKIILYITHNEKVKDLFAIKYFVENGQI